MVEIALGGLAEQGVPRSGGGVCCRLGQLGPLRPLRSLKPLRALKGIKENQFCILANASKRAHRLLAGIQRLERAVSSQQSAISGQQSAISGQQSAISGQQSANCPSCSLRPFLPSQTPLSLCASSPNLGEQWLDGTGNKKVTRNKKTRRRHLNFQFSIFNFQFSIFCH